MQAQPVLELQEVSKDYPGVRALTDISLSLRKGEIHGLVGENGAGKSTLIKILAGLIKAGAGDSRRHYSATIGPLKIHQSLQHLHFRSPAADAQSTAIPKLDCRAALHKFCPAARRDFRAGSDG